jgi:hypothetical protein
MTFADKMDLISFIASNAGNEGSSSVVVPDAPPAKKLLVIKKKPVPEPAPPTPPSAPAPVPSAPGAPKKLVVKKKTEPAAEVAKDLSATLAAAVPPAPPAPGAPKKLVVKKKTEPAAEVAKDLSATLAAAVPPAPPAAAPEQEKAKPKKVDPNAPRCDGRIEGEQMEMVGTKAPNGSPLHCYKPAQCERKSSDTVTIDEDGGQIHLCKVCVKRYNARTEHPDNWHGIFDDDGAPETSHFEGGAWYTKKMAAVKPE